MADPNNPTGERGLVAVDKLGWKVLFLDPVSHQEMRSLPMPARPHEVAIAPDHSHAFVSIYGNGVYGNNSEPGRLIAIIDLQSQQHVGDVDLDPLRAPHGLMWDARGLLYASCDASGVVAVVDPERAEVVGSIATESHGCHMIAMLPDGERLYAENEDDQPYVSVLDARSRRMVGKVPVPNGAAGIISSPDGGTVLVVDNFEPSLLAIAPQTGSVTRRIQLEGHSAPAQRVRWSPDGRYVLVTSTEEPLTTILDGGLNTQMTLRVGRAPMGVAFHPDGRTALVANHGAGTVSILDLEARQLAGEFPAGKGVETLAYF